MNRPTRSRLHAVLAAVATAILALIVRVGTPSPSLAATSGPPINVPVILSLSGPGAFVGKDQQQILTVLESTTNAAGGLKGRPVHFEILDDQSNPQVAVQLANGILEKPNPIVLGPSLFGSCAAVEPILKDRAVDYCYSPGGNPPAGSYAFSSGVASKDISIAGVRFLRSRGVTKIGGLFITDATGQDAERTVIDALKLPENGGLSLIDTEHFAPTDLSVSAQFSRLTAAGAQACFCWATGSGLVTMMHGYSDAGLQFPVITSTGNMTKALMDQIAPFKVRELYFVAFPYFAAPDRIQGPIRAPIAAFRKAVDAAGIKPNAAAGYVWDASSIALDALRQLGPSTTADQIRSFIANLRGYAGINGVYDFRNNPQRGLDSRYATIVRWDEAQGTWIAATR